MMKFNMNSQVAFGIFVAAAVLAGCDDSSSKTEQTAECTSNEQCADRQDGKTQCDTMEGVCVNPDTPMVECTSNVQCVGRQDGKTQCDTANGVCVNPVTPVVECTSNEQCVGRQDGKTQCNTEKGICEQPAQLASCGDGKLDADEVCDTTELDGVTCQSWYEFVGGTIVCDNTCHFDTSGCVECTETDTSKCKEDQICIGGHCVDDIHEDKCGDGIIGDDENCEHNIAITKTCADVGGFIAGDLGCDAVDCSFDTSACVECSDTDLSRCKSNETCEKGKCVQIQSECGNDKIEGAEICDGNDLGGKSCKDWPEFVDGTLACGKSCSFDTRGCVECTEADTSKCGKNQICMNGNCVDPGHEIKCGDGIIEGEEECEEGKLNGQTCADQSEGRPAGELKCSACKFNAEDCMECSTNAHCADRKDGKTICQDNVCVDPATIVIPKVVISQIYPGGGNSGAVFNTKYVELLNIDENEATLSNWSIQYASSNKETIASVCKLPETVKIPKGGYYLIALNKAGTDGDAIPDADFTCTKSVLTPAASAGKLFLVNSSEELPSSKPTSGYVDAVGYGSANWGEGDSPMASLSAKIAGLRKRGGCVDTDNNAKDFEKGTPTPRNSASPKNLCEAQPEPVCKNNTLEEGEDCDGNLFKDNKTACTDWKSSYTSGTVKCRDNCTIDYSNCKTEVCKNNKLDTGEDCDGNLFKGNKTACSDWNSIYMAGKVKCTDTCEIDYSNCETEICKNNKLDDGEDCDGNLFRGNKTACKDWNASYVAGSVKCSNACTIDYSDCKTTLCKNNNLDEGEDCDGNLFKGNKTSCQDWKPDEYNTGNVSCKNDCTIDYSACKYIPPCLTGQEWSEKYNSCVYPISSKQDLIDLSDKWNSQGKTAYPVNDGESLIFLLKKNVDMGELTEGTWTSIGSQSYPFEGGFYGEDHTITATLKDSKGLWNYTSHATIQDFTLKVNASGESADFIAGIVEDSTIRNIVVSGVWNAVLHHNSAGLVSIMRDSTLDNISINLDAKVKCSPFSCDISPLMYSADSSTLNRISINGSLVDVENSDAVNYYGFVHALTNSTLSNSEFNMNVSTINHEYGDSHIAIIASDLSNSVIDKINIRNVKISKLKKDWSYLIYDGVSYEPQSIISNIEVNLEFSNTDRSFLFWDTTQVSIVNSLFNSVVKEFSVDDAFYKAKFINDIFAQLTELNDTPDFQQDVYFKADVDEKKVTASMLNQNLVDHKESMPSGVYLPWKQDSDGRFYLDFNAKESEMYVIP